MSQATPTYIYSGGERYWGHADRVNVKVIDQGTTKIWRDIFPLLHLIGYKKES